MAVITDNNRTNQAFFKLFNTPESKPWKTSDGIFLLYDYVHLLKSVRNNWITEKTQNLEFCFVKLYNFISLKGCLSQAV